MSDLDDRDDVLSLGGNSDEEIFDNETEKMQTRSDKLSQCKTRGNKKRKSAIEPGVNTTVTVKPSKQRHVTKKSTGNDTCLDINELKSALGIDTMLQSISTLAKSVKKISDVHVGQNWQSTAPNTGNETVTTGLPSATVSRPILSLDQGESNFFDNEKTLNDFNLSYLDTPPPPSPSLPGVDPQVAFQNAFESVDNEKPLDDDSSWNIPQLNPDEVTGPKIGSGLAKAVNAALSVKSSKETMNDIGKKYNRPENCTLLKVPRVNKEIWDVLGKQAHSSDLSFLEIQKSLAQGLVPIVNLADQLANNKEIDNQKTKAMLSDSISLLGYGFYNLSMKRRHEIRNHLNPRYRKICSSDVPISENLFGDSCMSKLKDMGDINKYPLSSNRGQGGNYSAYRNRAPLNYRGAAGNFQQHNQTYQYS
ncbi:uncharacterized protein LOC134253118 [Saccostrea cucullata]|uniref:uncharacterized protein LOC134253118 n=1 Tax=Saccostrea cuccullata TaxID=36930 RepID=UPI002ED2B03B